MLINETTNYKIVTIDKNNEHELSYYKFNYYSYEVILNYLKEEYKFELVIFKKTNEVVHFTILK